jgi:hypothetical protein
MTTVSGPGLLPKRISGFGIVSNSAAATEARMNAPLRAACESIRALLAEAGRSEVRSRYAIGAIVADVKRSRHKYGARAVAQLSDALGTDEQTLYRCASVAECWSQAQLEALLDRTTALGQPLSFSHFVLLASVSAAQARAELFERAVHEGLSVRRLALLVEAPSGASGSGRESRDPIGRVLRTTERLAREIESIDDELRPELESAPRLRADARTALEQAIATTDRLRSVLELRLERLRSAQAPSSTRAVPRRLASVK